MDPGIKEDGGEYWNEDLTNDRVQKRNAQAQPEETLRLLKVWKAHTDVLQPTGTPMYDSTGVAWKGQQ